jgi:hypothetical protein
MSPTKLALALVGVALVCLAFPDSAHAWTPGTHIYLGETVLANLSVLPAAVADLLRSYPFDFLYGNIAADSSIAKHYAPLGRHCHYWHVGQEIHDLAESDSVRAFGLGYLCHLSADTVAHNYFVPRQLMLTSSTAAVGHSYWETRVESHLGDAYSRTAKDVILLEHNEADAHLDRIIAPTIFSVRTNRRLFRGMVHLTETTSWQRATRVAREYSRWRLDDGDVERHLGLSYDYMMELLGDEGSTAHQLDPSGERPLKSAKVFRRRVLRETGRRNIERLRTEALGHFGLPERPLRFWTRVAERLPWGAPADAALSPKALVNGARRR